MSENCFLVWMKPLPSSAVELVLGTDTGGVSEVGCARTTLAHRNMWFGKRKVGRVRDEELLIPGRTHGQPWYGAPAVLQSVTKCKIYQWNLETSSKLKTSGGFVRTKRLCVCV